MKKFYPKSISVDENKEPIIIYITGSHRSGSTLVDMILGSHKDICSVGEIVSLKRYFNSYKRCACGNTINNCSFWIKVDDEVSKMLKISAPCSKFRPIGKKTDLIKCLMDPLMFPKFEVSNVFDKILLKAICKISGQSIIVDSSKSIARLLYYMFFYKGRVVFIYIIRDPRAVIHSLLKSRGYNRKNLIHFIYRWKTEQYMLNIIFRLIRQTDKVSFQYKDFCLNPSNILKRLMSFLDLPFNPKMLSYWTNEHHNISGNAATRSKIKKGIFFREAWKSEMPEKYIKEIENKTCAVMEKYLYI